MEGLNPPRERRRPPRLQGRGSRRQLHHRVGQREAADSGAAPGRRHTETSVFPDGTNPYTADWEMPPGSVADTRVVVESPDRPEWATMFGEGGGGGGGNMAAYYEYAKGGSAERFSPPICPGPPRSCCSNNFPYCGVPGSMSFNATAALGPEVSSALLSGRTSGEWTASRLMAVHGWWSHPVWYNLVFGVGAARHDPATGTLAMNFSRGGNQASQGAHSLDHWWLEGDQCLLDAGDAWCREIF